MSDRDDDDLAVDRNPSDHDGRNVDSAEDGGGIGADTRQDVQPTGGDTEAKGEASHEEAHGHDDHGHAADPDARVTSPMQRFTSGQVGVGFVVLLVGLLVVFGIPLLLV